MAQQLSFDLPVSVSLGAADFFVAPPNEAAYAMICNDAAWPDGKLALVGPKGSGKSHLSRVWQEHSGADILTAATLTGGEDLPAPGASVAVENMGYLPPEAEEYLFRFLEV